jgi:hypothetical protein
MIENEPKANIPKPNVSHSIHMKQSASFDNSVIQSQSMLNSKYELLSGYLDGELTQQEAQKVNLLLESDLEYKQLHDEMASMRHEVQSLSLQESELETLDRLFQEPVAKTTRIFGFALLAVSSVILVTFIVYSVFINAAISLLVKFAIGLLGFGSLFLLYSVLRQRMISDKKDKYNRVKI